jgi:mannose-6-phosphate isomerase-like protein (cupin superfamily)
MNDYVEDPILRQRYRFSREGDVLCVDIWAEPGAGVPNHFHPSLTERWQVVEGEFLIRAGRKKLRPEPGAEPIVVEPGVRHSFENVGPSVGHVRAKVDPAMEMEEFLTDAAALSKAGRFTRGGTPKGIRGMLEVADFAMRYRDSAMLAFPPPLLQRMLFPPLARLARWRRQRAAGKPRAGTA